jgi:mannitol/fructose-specific phosphotransferase system IIA component (Ntr-type)
MKLYNNLKTELLKTDLKATNLEELLAELIQYLKLQNLISNEKLILNKLMERERLGSTSIGNHAAVPHTKLKDIKAPIILVGISRKGILYNEKDNEVVHLIILILSPNDSPIIHLQILAAAAALIKKSPQLIKETLTCSSPEELLLVIKKYETIDD